MYNTIFFLSCASITFYKKIHYVQVYIVTHDRIFLNISKHFEYMKTKDSVDYKKEIVYT